MWKEYGRNLNNSHVQHTFILFTGTWPCGTQLLHPWISCFQRICASNTGTHATHATHPIMWQNAASRAVRLLMSHEIGLISSRIICRGPVQTAWSPCLAVTLSAGARYDHYDHHMRTWYSQLTTDIRSAESDHADKHTAYETMWPNWTHLLTHLYAEILLH